MFPLNNIPIPKLPQVVALYLREAPPPVIFVYECRNCIVYKENGTCALVAGDILPGAWCILWFPKIGGI